MFSVCIKKIRQKVTFGRTILLLFAFLVGLQALHMVILTQVEEMQAKKNQRQLAASRNQAETAFYSMKRATESREVIDYSGTYQIVNYLYGKKSKRASHYQEVTLISQCSLNHLHHLVKLSQRWQGPISLTVFSYNEEILPAVTMVLQLVHCVPELRYNLTLHLAFPFKGTLAKLPAALPKFSPSCDELVSSLQKQTETSQNYAEQAVQYPNNLLRNIAIRNSGTGFIFVVDIDMVPSANLRQDFLKFAKNQILPKDTVYVVPAFEIDSRIQKIPSSKSTLLNMWKKNLVQPFYYNMCWKCQKHTDYEAWQNLPLSSTMIVGYEVEWKDPWEPFYIAPANIPMYDERFRQYGFNRISQVCELHIAGYTFAVLNKAFLVHHGFKAENSFHSSKKEEQDRNRAHFRNFKSELKKKYPDSNRTCYYRKLLVDAGVALDGA